ncbi:hypothetical protein BGW36DRAFT_424573 [Talaromyces proteolyticus]|uniref:Uncharacterized protein n=1 Tax=Talaromyces proteolyticus TaxID=1131652 RepID=A0AAD4Q3Y3_9EURO|nr:uncharacterized protein BGW36DRAFT_424573 [Talaromyces proteolyticus]KAH8702293.1 hypothetical protein BGW36DRAFT_424573 [Talaromyces proteolyticus]
MNPNPVTSEWTDDPEELDLDSEYWSDPESPARTMAAAYGLANPTPILCSTRQSGNCMYLIESQSKYYLWNQIESDVWHIESPTIKNEILRTIGTQGVSGLQVKRLNRVTRA